MMQKTDFSKLKEYDSLSKRLQLILSEIIQESERTLKIQSLIDKHISNRKEIKADISRFNTEILDKESQVKTLSEQKTRLINQGTSEEKLNDYQTKIDQFETDAFILLEKIDQLENELNETHQFEIGAKNTLKEIESEVLETNTTRRNEIERIESHLQELLSELPESTSQILSKLMSKKMAHGPFTKISEGSCMMCRFKLSKTDEAEIDVHQLLKQCSQCGRIFIPYGV